MENMNSSQKTINRTLEERGAEPGISEADLGGKLKIEGKDSLVSSRHHLGDSTEVSLALFGTDLAAICKETQRHQHWVRREEIV